MRPMAEASSARFRERGLGPAAFPESPISRHERLKHVKDQRDRIDHLAVGLRVQRGIAVEIGLGAGRQWRLFNMQSLRCASEMQLIGDRDEAS
jgi:hypothetical protein